MTGSARLLGLKKESVLRTFAHLLLAVVLIYGYFQAVRPIFAYEGRQITTRHVINYLPTNYHLVPAVNNLPQVEMDLEMYKQTQSPNTHYLTLTYNKVELGDATLHYFNPQSTSILHHTSTLISYDMGPEVYGVRLGYYQVRSAIIEGNELVLNLRYVIYEGLFLALFLTTLVVILWFVWGARLNKLFRGT